MSSQWWQDLTPKKKEGTSGTKDELAGMNFSKQDIEDPLEDALFYASVSLTQNWLRSLVRIDL